MYICIYVCIYVYMYVCMYICIYLYMYMYVCIYVYIHVYVFKMYIYSFILLLDNQNNIQRKVAWGLHQIDGQTKFLMVRWWGGEDSMGTIEQDWTQQQIYSSGLQTWKKLPGEASLPQPDWKSVLKIGVDESRKQIPSQFDRMFDSINVFWYVSYIYIIQGLKSFDTI